MASEEEIASLRLLIGEPDDVAPFTDDELSDRIDAADGDLDLVSYEIWTEKAASYSNVVDMSESGSSRNLSQLQKQALAMAAEFKRRGDASLQPSGTRVHRLTR